MNRPRTITAKYPDICAQTGTCYPAGTPIYKGTGGKWIALCNAALTTAAPSTLTGTQGGITTGDDKSDGRPYHDAPSFRGTCGYCEAPCLGSYCIRCARACGEYD